MSGKSLRQQRSHCLDGRYVEHAIGFFLTEVSLECRDGIACVAVKVAGRRHRIAIAAEHVLKFLDGRIGLPQHIEGSIRDDRMRLDPKAKPGPVQAGPRKLLARVALQRRVASVKCVGGRYWCGTLKPWLGADHAPEFTPYGRSRTAKVYGR